MRSLLPRLEPDVRQSDFRPMRHWKTVKPSEAVELIPAGGRSPSAG